MTIKHRIETANSIYKLCHELNKMNGRCVDHDVNIDQLPVFSAHEPLESGEVVYSWDEDSVLLNDELTSHWFVELRCQCGQAQGRSCICD